MSGKVFHIDDKTHRLVSEYCSKHALRVRDWVADILRKAVENGVIYTKIPVSRNKVFETTPPNRYDPDNPPWERPPFWFKDDTINK